MPSIVGLPPIGACRSSVAEIFQENSATFPSSQWQSTTKSSYCRDFTPGPPAKLPEIVRKQGLPSNNPHGKNAFIFKEIEPNKTVCDVSSKHGGQTRRRSTVESVSQSSYTPKVSPRLRPIVPSRTVDCIVPSNATKEAEERMLPADAHTLLMMSEPVLRYKGRKKALAPPKGNGVIPIMSPEQLRKHNAPPKSKPRRRRLEGPRSSFEGTGIIYSDLGQRPYWESIISQSGDSFPRKKRMNHPKDNLNVKGFDGGAPMGAKLTLQPATMFSTASSRSPSPRQPRVTKAG